MKITLIEKEVTCGKSIEFSTQELIALKDKQEAIEAVFIKYGEESDKNISASVKTKRETIETLKPLFEDMHNFIGYLVEGVRSTSEVHRELFMSEREKELEQVSVED